MRHYARTDVGLSRRDNQDAAYSRRLPSGEVLLAVADGMGGMPDGERASALAIAAFETPPEAGEAPEAYLRGRLDAAHGALAADVDAQPARAGMGTTVVAALVRGDQAWLAHIGDSRAYLWRGGALEALTLDHNLAGEAVRAGELDRDEALNDRRRHLLTRALGGRRSEAEYLGPFAIDGASALLLVSDGVAGVIEHRVIARLVEAHACLELVNALVHTAHDLGAPDNIAIALLDQRCA